MDSLISQAMLYANTFLKSIQEHTGNLQIPDLSLISIGLLFLLLVFFLIGVTFGRSKILVALLSLYIAKIIEVSFPYFDWINKELGKNTDLAWLHLFIFIAGFAITFFLLQRSMGGRFSLSETSIVSISLLSLLEIGLLASIILDYLPAEIYKTFPQSLTQYFTTKTAQFWWSAAPILALLFMRKHHND